ncbi:MAG: vWA domain-containing protein [Ferrimicrobium sp.]
MSGSASFVGFAVELRRAGVVVPVSSTQDFVAAMTVVDLADRECVFCAGLATLVRRPEDRALYRLVFDRYFSRSWIPPTGQEVASAVAALDDPDVDGDGIDETEAAGVRVVRFSEVERLRDADLATLTPSERAEAFRLIVAFRWASPKRRTNRSIRSEHLGRELDLRRTLRGLVRTDGEPIYRWYRERAERPRRVIFLVDVSGSMAPYAEAMLRLAYGAHRGLGSVEVFTLGTRLTRVTRSIDHLDPSTALARVHREVKDWSGGTRLGDGLERFVRYEGARGLARGAVVVILSDGWDRGEPRTIEGAMARLHRLAARVIWVNPLVATPGYAPLARGMAAALPYVDHFVDGGRVRSLEALAITICQEGGRGARRHRTSYPVAS